MTLLLKGAKRKQSKPTGPDAPQSSTVANLPAPARGWITTEAPMLMQPGGADVLENWIPTIRGIRPRGGSNLHATLHASNDCTSLMKYVAGTSEILFGSTADSIFEITSPASPSTPPTADVTGQTSGVYSWANFSTSANAYLVAVNGSDARQLYNGATWSAVVPGTITGGPGTNGSLFSFVWVYKTRLWFIEKNTLSAWYLPADSVSGAATEFPLTGVFQKGGNLLFGITWSSDSGSGLTDTIVFITTEGEAAVYQGEDPADPTWGQAGRYEVGRPLGQNAIMRAGGDVLIATEDGLVSLAAAVQKDKVALVTEAVTNKIEDQWRTYALDRNVGEWSITKWSLKNYAIIGIPSISGQTLISFVINLQTGAMAPITGWDVNCAIEAGGQLYFGTKDGTVFTAETVGNDNGENYYCTYIGLPETFGAMASEKTALMMRATFIHSTDILATIGIATNFDRSLGVYPASPVNGSNDVWDTGLWDVSKWGGAGTRTVTTNWSSVVGSGFTLAPVIQMTFGTNLPPDIELVGIELLYEAGGLIV